MATQFPSNGYTWGISADQTGILLDSQTWSYSDSEKVILDKDGDPKAVFTYGEVLEIALAGYVPQTSGFSSTMSEVVSLATTPTDFFIDGSSSASALVRTVTRTNANEDAQRIEVGLKQWPGISLV